MNFCRAPICGIVLMESAEIIAMPVHFARRAAKLPQKRRDLLSMRHFEAREKIATKGALNP